MGLDPYFFKTWRYVVGQLPPGVSYLSNEKFKILVFFGSYFSIEKDQKSYHFRSNSLVQSTKNKKFLILCYNSRLKLEQSKIEKRHFQFLFVLIRILDFFSVKLPIFTLFNYVFGEISYDSSILPLSPIFFYCSILLLENIIAYKNKEKVLENAQIRVENRNRL